jgi:hypothetical protein
MLVCFLHLPSFLPPSLSLPTHVLTCHIHQMAVSEAIAVDIPGHVGCFGRFVMKLVAITLVEQTVDGDILDDVVGSILLDEVSLSAYFCCPPHFAA